MSRCHVCGLRNSECHTRAPRAVGAGATGRRKMEVEENGVGPSAIMVEKDGLGFSIIEVGNKRAGPSGLGDLEMPEYHTRTPQAVGARGRRIRQLGNDRSKIHARPKVLAFILYLSLTNCIYHLYNQISLVVHAVFCY